MNKDNINETEMRKDECMQNYFRGEIKFRQKKKIHVFRYLFKGMSYFLVAVISGGITGAYITNKKLENIVASNTNTALLQNNKPNNSANNTKTIVVNNSVTRVAADVGQAVVGISSNNTDSSDDDSDQNESGMIFRSDGYIVTTYQAIKGYKTHFVRLSSGKNGKYLEASVVGFDTFSNLAVLKVKAKNLPTVVFGDSTKVQVGDTAVAIGNPLGEEFTGQVTAGVISALNKEVKVQDQATSTFVTYKLLQTDADINIGNSGGALCNQSGEVVGINILVDNAQGEKGGYAISINEAKKVINDIIKSGHVDRPYIGIDGEDYVSQDKKTKGVLVKSVIQNSGADKAAIKASDVIIELGQFKLKSVYEMNDIVQKYDVGDIVPCKIIRNGKTLNIKIVLSKLPVSNS